MAYDIKFLRGSQATYKGLAAPDEKTFYYTTETVEDKTIKRLYLGTIELSNSEAETDIDSLKERLNIAEANIGSTTTLSESLKAAITRIDGDEETTGSIKKAIKDALALLNGTATIATKSGKAVTIKAGVAQTDGKIANDTNADITLADVASTGKAEDVTADAAEVGEEGSKKTIIPAGSVQSALQKVAELIEANSEAGEVSVVEGGESGSTLKSYTFYQGEQVEANKITKIDIPKDFLVKSGEVVVDPEGQPAGTYLKLVLNVKDGTAVEDSTIYINVGSLIEYVTGGDTAEVKVAVSDNHVVTATIEKIAASKIVYKAATDDDAEITVKGALDTLNGADTVEGSVAKAIKDKTGDLANLETTEKGTLVGAINEVRNSATGVTAVETPAEGEGADGQIKVTKKAANGDETVTYATPKNLKTVATTGKAEDVAFEKDATSEIAATDVNAAILELEDDYKAAIEALDGSAVIATEANGVVTIKAGVKEDDGKIAQGTGADIVLDKVATTGAAEDVDYDNTTSGLTATDVQGAIDEVAGNIGDMDGTATIASKSGNIVTIKGGIEQTDGEIANDSSADIVLDDVAVTGKAADLDLEADATSGLTAGSVQAFAEAVTTQLTWGTF